MLGPDYLDFAKADIAVVKDNRFTVNLTQEKKPEVENIVSALDDSHTEPEIASFDKASKRLKAMNEPLNFQSEQKLRAALKREETTSEQMDRRRTQKL